MGAESLRCRSVDGRHGQVQPLQQAAEVTVGQEFLGLGDDGVLVGTLAVPPQRQIHHDFPPGACRGQVPGDRHGKLGQLFQPRVRGDEVDGPALDVVVGGAEQPPVVLADLQVAQLSDPVEPAGVDLQQRPAQPGVFAATPPAQQLCAQRLRAGDEPVDSVGPVRAVGIVG